MEAIRQYDDYSKKIQGDDKIVIKFFADWCPDCTRMNMFIDPILEEYSHIDWYELNRDEVPEAADENDVMGIPSLLVFQNGEKLAHLHSADAKSPESVKDFLQKSI
ncbi:thioredoxin family protein [Salinicoccus roseus]|uniref:Thioredoxin n=1 Tax=Salinicoccus roseus TaxID=45670 RepID=A0A0C2HQ36_9STAP|nr:thioredoxin family protein [Salinicoccus roseus]KIH71611.1 thioredoxin [Salinicoccus roseus]MBY8909534.1 thioredoxin family protein [Salinicoccus roseus]MDB0579701.1 thioredoxin family protein [Salinicoccus roseus]